MVDDYSASTSTTGAVAVGGSATGEVETGGDQDWFAVTLEAGRTYRIDLEGSHTGAGTLSDPYLRGIHDAYGVLLAGTTDDDSGVGYNSRVTFRAQEDGTYYVAAGAYNRYREGTYTLSVTDITDESQDDHPTGTGTTGTVAVGGSATGDIEYGNDRDWFAVELVAGRTYHIGLEGSGTGAGTLHDPYLYGVHDAQGNLIPGTTDDDGGQGYNSRLEFTPDADGTYYISAGAYAYGDYEGTYTLSVIEAPADLAAGTGTTGTVAVGGSATGDIEYGNDRDWFAVELVAGRTYQIDLEGSRTGAGTLRDPYLYGVHDADGVLLPGTTNDDGGVGRNSRATFTPAEDGTYYVAAGVGASSGHTEGTYTVSVTETSADLAADTTTAGAVAVGGSAAGDIEYENDRDWFAVTLEAGKTYRIDLEGSNTGAGTLGNPHLYGVHDADGVLLAGTTNGDGGVWFNSRVTFAAQEDGTYYVAAGAYDHRSDFRSDFNSNVQGTYTLSVTDITDEFQDDHPTGTGTTGTVAVGGSATGDIEHGNDRDWFAVTLEAGTTYRIDLEGSRTGAGTLHDPYLYGVHDAQGNLIPGTTDDDGGQGWNSRLEFTPDADGTYYISAGANAYGDYEGTYTLSVIEAPADLAAGTGTTGTVAVGGSTTGEVETAGDRDWFAVTLEAGRTYRIDLEGLDTEAGTLRDPYLYGVHDADGNLVPGTTNDDGDVGRNSRATFTPAEDGTYYVAAGVGASSGHTEGTYTVSVTETSADLAADTTTAGAVAVGGSGAGDIEYENDRDWFAVTLEAGKTYRIDLEGSNTGAGTLGNPHLYGVHDAAGVLLAGTTNDDAGVWFNSRVTFTAQEDGTYYVAAGAYDDYRSDFNSNVQGTYTLSVTDITDEFQDDHPTGTGTTGTVAVGGSATGDIETAGDLDWFAVTLEAGTAYRIDLEGSWTGAGTLSDPYLRGVHDADGNLISGTLDDDGGSVLNSRLAFTPDEAGTYYVAAGAYGSGSGTYTLSVEDGL